LISRLAHTKSLSRGSPVGAALEPRLDES
jgi:hypothetical protein